LPAAVYRTLQLERNCCRQV